MNLAQAVAVCCYEWSRGRAPATPQRNEASVDSRLRLLQIVAPLLEASAFFHARTRDLSLRRLRRILMNARVTPEDNALLMQAVRKVEYALGRQEKGS
jgi:tRNA/rRNA methyltransferase